MSRRFAAGLLVACLVVFAVPGIAGAAAPVATGPMDVHLWAGADPGQLLVIVGITLPEDVELPATVRLPVVNGMNVVWAGEISTGTVTQDIERKPVVKKGKDGSYAEFEVSESRIAQIELGGVALSAKGTDVTTKVEFVQTVPAELTQFAVRLPATASEVEIEPEPATAPNRNSAGEAFYTLPAVKLAVGAKQVVEVKYSTALPSADSGGLSQMTIIIIVLAALIGVVLVVLIAVMIRQRSA